MTDFICPQCERKFDDLDEEEFNDVQNIREEGHCIDCWEETAGLKQD